MTADAASATRDALVQSGARQDCERIGRVTGSVGVGRLVLCCLLALVVLVGLAGPQAGSAHAGSDSVNPPLSDVAEVVAGSYHTCARLVSGQARCWGYNAHGGLGDGTTANRLRPVVVSNEAGTGPLTGIAEIAAGIYHSCALLVSGQARCWGYNDEGGLGDGTTANRLRPVVVSNEAGTGPLTGIAEITAGGAHTCARLVSGQARCWGFNSYGGLGDGTTNHRARPVVVSNEAGTGPLTGIAEMSAGGYHACARLVSAKARCWGYNRHGELGDGTTSRRVRPVVVSNGAGTGPLTGITEISAGGPLTCARLSGRQARCWGRNLYGGLGDGTTTNRARPVVVSIRTGPLTDIAQITAGTYHSCARLESGQARCWGYNSDGRLGDGTTTNRVRPVFVLSP